MFIINLRLLRFCFIIFLLNFLLQFIIGGSPSLGNFHPSELIASEIFLHMVPFLNLVKIFDTDIRCKNELFDGSVDEGCTNVGAVSYQFPSLYFLIHGKILLLFLHCPE